MDESLIKERLDSFHGFTEAASDSIDAVDSMLGNATWQLKLLFNDHIKNGGKAKIDFPEPIKCFVLNWNEVIEVVSFRLDDNLKVDLIDRFIHVVDGENRSYEIMYLDLKQQLEILYRIERILKEKIAQNKGG